MLGRLILLFTAVPLLELALLLWIGGRVGVGPTIVLILATGVIGAALARHQGFATWRRFHAALEAGRLPGTELVEALLILVAGAVLLTPGVLTDAAGFLLLIPPVRHALARRIEASTRSRIVVGRPPGSAPRTAGRPPNRPRPRSGHPGPADSTDVIDAEFEVVSRQPPEEPPD